MIGKSDSYVPPLESIREAFAGASADAITFVVRSCLEVGAWDHALAILTALGPARGAGLRLSEAVARFVSGDRERALAIADELLASSPDLLPARAVRAELLARSGDREGAKRELLALVARYPDYPGAHGLLATLVMPGPHYRQVLSLVHDRLRPRCYVEIGVDTGATLALARHSELIVGVDPALHAISVPLPPTARLFGETSDAFFAARSREDVLGGRRIDLGFVDGLHRFENALRDFANLERWSHPNGTIVLHDCVPIVPRTATRERSTKFWVGDTWKVVFALARFRPDLRIRTVLAPPSGLVVVRRLDPASRVLLDRLDVIVETFASNTWTAEPGCFPPEFCAVANDDRGLADALG